MNRLHGIGIGSTAISLGLIAKSFLAFRGQFFPTCIQITSTNLNLLVLLTTTFYYVILLAKLMQSVFFGPLRVLEVEHLYERSWYAVMDTCLALTMFRDGFDFLFILRFGTLLFCKIFHWIISDRVDFMDQSLELRPGFHIKMGSVMALFLTLDVSMLISAVNHTLVLGPTMLIVFGFEYALLTSALIGTFCKYCLQTIESRRGGSPWEEKTTYFAYVDLALDFCKLIAYSVLFGILVHFYGIPLHILRDVYMTLHSFSSRVKKLILSRRATANMETRYPTATELELADTDKICIICREDMVVPAGEGQEPTPRSELPKKLPCGHIFHFRCLRSWLDRQQACPTWYSFDLILNSRRSVLEAAPTPLAPPNPLPGNVVNPAPPIRNLQDLLRQLQRDPTQADLVSSSSNHQPIPDHTHRTAQIMYPISLTALNPTENTKGRNLSNQAFDLMSDEQLREMEGSAREAIISRLKALENIQTQLSTIAGQLNQLCEIMPSSGGSLGRSQNDSDGL